MFSFGNSLVVQWLGHLILTAKGAGSVTVQGTKIPQATQGSYKENPKKQTKKKRLVLWVMEILWVLFVSFQILLLIFFFSFIFISWRLIILQYGSGFCHTLTWIIVLMETIWKYVKALLTHKKFKLTFKTLFLAVMKGSMRHSCYMQAFSGCWAQGLL